MKIHYRMQAAIASILMMLLVMALSSGIASAQTTGVWIPIFTQDISIPRDGEAHIRINPVPYALLFQCTGGTGHVDSYVVNTSDGALRVNHPIDCYSGSWEGVGLIGLDLTLHISANADQTVHLVVSGYNQVDETVNTTPVPPTATPDGYVPPTATSMATSVPYVPPTPLCGLSMTSPCWVAQSTPITGGGGGDFNASSPVAVSNFPTPIPTATNVPAIQAAIDSANSPPAVGAVPGSKIGDIQMMPTEVAGQADNYTAAIKAELWDFGCPIDFSARGITMHICIKYDYIKSITLVGIDLPIDVITEVMIVLAVVYMVKRR